ncbi:MAG: EAL domain-containing protein [Lachnospiraceae bacterium]|nr:EAL domain-containing protein [Lachnospiraceae bacterium]
MTRSKILERIYNKIITQADIITFELDKDNRIVYVNSVYEKYLGDMEWQDMEMSNPDVLKKLVHKEDLEECLTLFINLELNECRSVICRIKDVTGHYKWYRITLCNFYDEEFGEFTRKIGMMQDVNNELTAFRQIKDYEEYDSITGLYNENKFEFEARALILSNPDVNFCTITFDINKFKIINEVYGTKLGNTVLKYVASVIKKVIPSMAICSRLYADNFAVFMPFFTDEDIVSIVWEIHEKIAQNPYNLTLHTSYGIFRADSPAKLEMQIDTMKDRALIAKSTIKKDVINYYVFFSDEVGNEIVMEQDIEKNMHTALKEKQFEVYLQPKVELSTEKLMGAEALIRWRHPEKGLIGPDNFVPIFEKNGFIIQLDKYVCEEVCKLINKWVKMGIKPVPISVNISRLHIYNDTIVSYLLELVEKYEVLPEYLRFEITETLFVGNMEALVDILQQLRGLGFKVEMDDFGSGYSSLNMLRNVPVDVIKIDKEFFDEKMSDNKGKIVVSHTIAMAKELDLEVLAEGVETEEHAQFLKDSNCDMAQGYLFSKPMTLYEFENRFLANNL